MFEEIPPRIFQASDFRLYLVWSEQKPLQHCGVPGAEAAVPRPPWEPQAKPPTSRFSGIFTKRKAAGSTDLMQRSRPHNPSPFCASSSPKSLPPAPARPWVPVLGPVLCHPPLLVPWVRDGALAAVPVGGVSGVYCSRGKSALGQARAPKTSSSRRPTHTACQASARGNLPRRFPSDEKCFFGALR